MEKVYLVRYRTRNIPDGVSLFKTQKAAEKYAQMTVDEWGYDQAAVFESVERDDTDELGYYLVNNFVKQSQQ